MVVVGKIYQKSAENIISENFKKVEVIVQTIEEFPNFYKIEFINGNISLLDNRNEDDTVKISCNLKGKLYEPQSGGVDVFMNLRAWKIETA